MAEPSGKLDRSWKMPTEKPEIPIALAPKSNTDGTNGTNSFDVEMGGAGMSVINNPNERPKCFSNLFEEIVFVFTVMMATASTTLIQGVVIINTSTIGRDLSMSSAQIAWIAAGIGLTSGSFVLFFGKTADLFGGKIQIIFGTILLSLISLVIFLAPGPMSMLVLCGFLGIGTAMVGPPAIGVLLATYPESQRRNRVTGALGAGNPLGFVIGSISSGLATKLSGNWRSSFMVLAIFFLVMTTFVVWTVPTTPRSGNRKTIIKQFDYLGATLTIIGTALVSAGLTEAPNLGWNSFKVLLMLLIGVFCILGFGVWETIFQHPLLDPSVWKNRTFTLCVLTVSLGYMSFITNNFWVALYIQDVQHFAPLNVGVHLMPQAISGVFWSYLGQSLISRINGTLIMAIGGLGYLVGAILVVFINENSSYWTFLFPAMVLSVIGADFQFIVSNLYVNKQMPTQASLAAGVLQTGRSLSITVGLAITCAVHGSMAETWAARSDQTYAYRYVYICTIAFSVASLLFIPFMRIEKQGSTPPSIDSSSASSSKTMLNDSLKFAQTDGAQDQIVTDEQKEKSPSLVQRHSSASLSSMATAGSYDSYFPRWSWEQMRRWPDDRNRIEPENVVYEVCIKCSQERRVLVQMERQDRDGSMNVDEEPEVIWDMEVQQSVSPDHSESRLAGEADERYNLSSHSSENMVPSIARLRQMSINPRRKSVTIWDSEALDDSVKVDDFAQPASEEPRQRQSGNWYRRMSPGIRYESPAPGERVLFNGYANKEISQLDNRRSNNPYRLSLTDTIQMPDMADMPASLLSNQLPTSPSPRRGRIWINRISSQSIDQQLHADSILDETRFAPHNMPDTIATTPKRQAAERSITFPIGRESYRDETTFDPPSMSSTPAMAPRQYQMERPAASPLGKTRGKGFTDIELSRGSDQFGHGSVLASPSRVLNSREMAMHYSARPRRERERRWGSQVGNAGGYDQIAVRNRGWAR